MEQFVPWEPLPENQEGQFSKWPRLLLTVLKFSTRFSLPVWGLTKFFWCQRRALRRAFRLLPFPSTRPVWAPPQEALEWGCHCEEALPGACLGQQSGTINHVSYSWLNYHSLLCDFNEALFFVSSQTSHYEPRKCYSVYTIDQIHPHHCWVWWISSAFGPN